MKVRLNITGTRPLMLHNVRLASPLNVYAKRMKAIGNEIKAKNARKIDVDADRLELARVEFEGGLYHVAAISEQVERLTELLERHGITSDTKASA